MAEGWLRHLAGDRFEASSAGVEPGTLNPLAVEAMREVGIDIAGARAEGVADYPGRADVDTVIIVCDRAAESCPADWPGAHERLHWFFDDPSAAAGSDEEKLAVFRRVRDEIRDRIEAWLSRTDASGRGASSRAR